MVSAEKSGINVNYIWIWSDGNRQSMCICIILLEWMSISTRLRLYFGQKVVRISQNKIKAIGLTRTEVQ